VTLQCLKSRLRGQIEALEGKNFVEIWMEDEEAGFAVLDYENKSAGIPELRAKSSARLSHNG
jgi:hypothetical protein